LPPSRGAKDFRGDRIRVTGAESQTSWRRCHPGRSYALFAGFLLAFLTPGIFLRDFWVYDEGRRALIALEMLLQRRWAVPSLMGEPILTKPPLFYWLETLSFRCFGAPWDWAARVPSALAGVAGALAFARLLQRVVGLEAGLFGGMALAVSPVYCWMAGQAEPEMLYVAAAIGAAACFFEGFERRRALALWHAGFFALAGLSCLAKGPVAPLALIVSLAVWRALARSPNRFARLSWAWGPLVFMAPLAFWVAAVVKNAHSPGALLSEAGTHLNSQAPHAKEFMYYFGQLDSLLFPWFFVLVAALVFSIWKMARRGGGGWRTAPRRMGAYWRQQGGGRLFLLVWSAVSFLSISAIPSKRYYYALSLAPPLCGLLAVAYQDLGSISGEARRPMAPRLRGALGWALAAAGLALLAAGLVASTPVSWQAYSGRNTLDAKALLIWGGAAAAGLAGLVALEPRMRPRFSFWRSAQVWLLFCTLCMAAAYLYVIHPRINKQWSLKIAAEEIERRLPPGAPVFTVGSNYPIWFYLGRPDARPLKTRQEVQDYLREQPAAIGVVDGENVDLIRHEEVEILYRSSHISNRDEQVWLVRKPPAFPDEPGLRSPAAPPAPNLGRGPF